MKSLFILVFTTLFSVSSFACTEINKGVVICPGDFATVGSYFSRGAEVVAVNTSTKMIGLKSIKTGNMSAFNADEVQFGKGCVEGVCVGNKATAGSHFSRGAEVVAVNTSTKMIGLKSIKTGDMSAFRVDQVQGAKGCVEGICVGDFATAGSNFSQGAEVVAVNTRTKMIGLKSIKTGDTSALSAYQVQVARECLEYGSNERELEFYESN